MSDRSERRGFTLLELVVALTIGGVAIAGAASALWTISEHSREVSDRARVIDARANGLRLLRQLARSFEVGVPGGAAFVGSPASARFAARCRTTDGGFERCWIRLSVLPEFDAPGALEAGKTRLTAVLPTGDGVDLLRSIPGGELRFLRSATDGGKWLPRWEGGISAPLAIGIISVRDTLIVRLGRRP